MSQLAIGMCIGSIATILGGLVMIQVLPLILWALGFIDMGLNPQTPEWLKRFRKGQ